MEQDDHKALQETYGEIERDNVLAAQGKDNDIWTPDWSQSADDE